MGFESDLRYAGIHGMRHLEMLEGFPDIFCLTKRAVDEHGREWVLEADGGLVLVGKSGPPSPPKLTSGTSQ
jgi:hypothetical protein